MSGEQEQVDLDFGRRVRSFRVRKGLSQQLLADRVGVSQSKLSDAETGVGVVQFTPSQILGLARELDVEPLELFGLPVATGVRAEGAIADFLLTARGLDESDIEALTITARQLASARAAALPTPENFPGWNSLHQEEQAAFERARQVQGRVARLRVAEPKATYRAGGNADGSDGRPPSRRRPGGAAGA